MCTKPHLQSSIWGCQRVVATARMGHQVTCPREASSPPLPFPASLRPQSDCLPGWGEAVALVPGRAALLHILQVGEEARFSVKSTRPCSFTLPYEVAVRATPCSQASSLPYHPAEGQAGGPGGADSLHTPF